MKRISVVVLVLVLVAAIRHTAPPLIVHEWGTITTRHAPDGTPEGRLNRIKPSEVLPAFVHRYEPAPTQDDPKKSVMKSPLAPGRPDVTMRLETPVIYFHPAAGSDSMPPFDVSLMFRGGIVNEFYPQGEASVAVDAERVSTKMRAGLIKSWWDGGVLDNYVVGSLRWNSVSLKATVPLPQTASRIWLAPRQVRSAGVATPSGEGERYLFYRGVAHLDALVQTELSQTEVRLRSPQRLLWLHAPSMTISSLWLVDIDPGGAVAFREQKQVRITKDSVSQEVGRLPLFVPKDYSAGGLAELRSSMKRELIGAGLFDDEAEAMLDTWKESYFEMPGLRVFYIVPREWIDYFLPLQVSVPNEMTRVLIGRIDLLRR